jgi:arginase
MPAVAFIQLPYDSGRHDERMGCGPDALINAGLPDVLRKRGWDVSVTSIVLPDQFMTAGTALVELQRRCAPLVRESIRRGAEPIILSGNCAPAALSAVSVLNAAAAGVIWFDAHGDFNTPETSPSGFLDGMAVALLTGRCWPKLLERLESFEPMAPARIIQIGVRNTDPEEEPTLSRSGIIRIGVNDLSRLAQALQELGAAELYVHLDVDVLDQSEGYANAYSCAGGLSLEQLRDALTLINATRRVKIASVTAYDPATDRDGRIARAVCGIIPLLAKHPS